MRRKTLQEPKMAETNMDDREQSQAAAVMYRKTHCFLYTTA